MKELQETQNTNRYQLENKLSSLNVLDKPQAQQTEHKITEEIVHDTKDTLLSGKSINNESAKAVLSDIAHQIIQGKEFKSIYDYLNLDHKPQKTDLSPITEILGASLNTSSEEEKDKIIKQIESKLEFTQHTRYEQWIQENLDKNNTSPSSGTNPQEEIYQDQDIPTDDSTKLKESIIQGLNVPGKENNIKNVHIDKSNITIDENIELEANIIQGLNVPGDNNTIENTNIKESNITTSEDTKLDGTTIQGMNISGNGNIISGAYVGENNITFRRRKKQLPRRTGGSTN